MLKIKNKINYWAAWTWMKFRFVMLKLWWYVITKWISMLAFWIIRRVETWNKTYYDQNIVSLYQSVREKKAFTFKSKIVGSKGNRHIQFLMIETEKGEIKIDISKAKHPNLYK